MVVCEELVRIHRTGSTEVQALQGLDLVVRAGEAVAVVGASGSGRSTLLGVLSGLDAPTAGRVRVAGWDLTAMTARQRVQHRRSAVGFVWQQSARNLVPHLTAAQNADLPQALAGRGRRERRPRTAEVLELVGVAHRADAAGRQGAHDPPRVTGWALEEAEDGAVRADEPDAAGGDDLQDVVLGAAWSRAW